MTLVRYSPFGAGQHFNEELKHVFDRFFGDGDAGDQSNVVTSQ
jgi:hypothetical protein